MSFSPTDLRAWAEKLTDEQLTYALYELRNRGAAVACYDANEVRTMLDGQDLDGVEDWMAENRDEVEEAMCDAARDMFTREFGGVDDD